MRMRKNSSQHTEPVTSRSVANHLTVKPWSTADITYGYPLNRGKNKWMLAVTLAWLPKGWLWIWRLWLLSSFSPLSLLRVVSNMVLISNMVHKPSPIVRQNQAGWTYCFRF